MLMRRLTRVQANGPGVLEGPTEKEEKSRAPVCETNMVWLHVWPQFNSLNAAVDGWQIQGKKTT